MEFRVWYQMLDRVETFKYLVRLLPYGDSD